VARSKGESDAVMDKSQARGPYAQAEPARVKVVVASVMQPGAVFRYVVAW